MGYQPQLQAVCAPQGWGEPPTKSCKHTVTTMRFCRVQMSPWPRQAAYGGDFYSQIALQLALGIPMCAQSGCHCTKAVLQPTFVAFLHGTKSMKYPIAAGHRGDKRMLGMKGMLANIRGKAPHTEAGLDLSFPPSALALVSR